MVKLFVYGTLNDPDVQTKLIGRTIVGVPDHLSGFRRDTTLFPPYPVAMPDSQHAIDGYIIEVTEQELAILDDYEGIEYIRIELMLDSGKQAWVYCGNPDIYGA